MTSAYKITKNFSQSALVKFPKNKKYRQNMVVVLFFNNINNIKL